MKSLVLLTTEGCHLCDRAVSVLQQVVNPNKYEVYLEDIAESEAMVEAYGLRIPVIKHETSGQELGWPFDNHTLSAFLNGLPD